MIKTKNVKVYGLQESLVRSGLPMRTGEPEDFTRDYLSKEYTKAVKRGRMLGKVKTGTGHDNFLKGIVVQFDLCYPEYFSPQLQRYGYVDIISSQSKMHNILKNGLNQNDFALPINKSYLDFLNYEIKNENFKSVINGLPLGFQKWMGISTNYLQLKTIRQQRRTHKLQEWGDFCSWIDTLPYFSELTNKNHK